VPVGGQRSDGNSSAWGGRSEQSCKAVGNMAHNGRTGLSQLIHERHCHGARPRSRCEEGTGKPEDRQCRAAGRVNRWPPALDSWSRVRPGALNGLPLLAHRKAGQQGMAWRSFGWSDPSPPVVVHSVISSPTLAVIGWGSARFIGARYACGVPPVPSRRLHDVRSWCRASYGSPQYVERRLRDFAPESDTP
jgi:hypothetical protein